MTVEEPNGLLFILDLDFIFYKRILVENKNKAYKNVHFIQSPNSALVQKSIYDWKILVNGLKFSF